MKVILGLGNPGIGYRFSRHNLGFLVVKSLARAESIKIKQRAFNCLLGKGRIENQEVLLGFPLTFMNLSGEAVALIVKQKKIKLTDLLIVSDDVNLPLGKIRIRAKGSDGGHKGLRSIIGRLQTEDFPRLRIGVSTPRVNAKRGKLTRHVLGRFNKREIKIINKAIELAASASVVWVKAGVATAMDRFN